MGTSYKDAGVDVVAGNELIQRIRSAVAKTNREELLVDLGGFASLATIPSKYKNPVLAFGTDGVGTKLELAREHGTLSTIGYDLVAMCANDVLVTGAEPYMFLDYFATGALDLDTATTVIESIARACQEAGCTLAGGETAEMPGFYPGGQFDVAGFCIGVAEREHILSQNRVHPGDLIIGLSSSGPHSNGFSLIRKLLSSAGHVPEEVLQEMLNPTTIYVKSVLRVLDKVHAAVHITGGGFQENVPRSLPRELEAAFDMRAIDIEGNYTKHKSFSWLHKVAQIEKLEMYSTFNCGTGMMLVVAPDDAQAVCESVIGSGINAEVIGGIRHEGASMRDYELVVGHDRFELS